MQRYQFLRGGFVFVSRLLGVVYAGEGRLTPHSNELVPEQTLEAPYGFNPGLFQYGTLDEEKVDELTPWDLVRLYLADDVWLLLVRETNRHFAQKNPEPRSDRALRWVDTKRF